MQTIKRATLAKSEEGCWLGERDDQENTEDNENTVYVIMMMVICRYTFVQIHRVYNIKNKT